MASVEPADQASSLFLLVIMAGAFMILAGILKLGRYTRFVSHSVMIGFLTGVAANIIFGQIPDLTGVDAEGGSSIAKALDVVLHPASIDLASLLTGFGAVALHPDRAGPDASQRLLLDHRPDHPDRVRRLDRHRSPASRTSATFLVDCPYPLSQNWA